MHMFVTVCGKVLRLKVVLLWVILASHIFVVVTLNRAKAKIKLKAKQQQIDTTKKKKNNRQTTTIEWTYFVTRPLIDRK